MPVEQLLILIMGVMTLGLLVGGFIIGRDNKDVSDRVTKLSGAADMPDADKALRKRDLNDSFNKRVLFPVAQKIFDKTQQFIPLSSKSFVTTKLIQAGLTKSHYPKVFLGIQLICCVATFGFLFTVTTFVGKIPWAQGVMVAIFFGLAGYALPLLWLIQQAGKRQNSIQKGLADFLDLLVICVEAGLGIDAAINKIANLKGNKTSTYLRDELLYYIRDVSFGRPRKEAMLDMANRTGVEDFNTIINALIQAYEMGSSVAHTLRVQSDTLRVKRLQKAEEKANKVPVKMVIPIYVFLFPAIFVAIFGPMAVILIEAFFAIVGNMPQS